MSPSKHFGCSFVVPISLRADRLARGSAWLLFFLCLAPALLHGDEPRAITSIGALRRLPPEQAAHALPVHVRGVITRCTHDEIYLQEGSDAVFVRPDPKRELYLPGDYVDIIGVTSEGHFLPIVIETASHRIDHRTLPTPIRANYDDLASGRLDCCWVEITGVVRTFEPHYSGGTVCRLSTDGTVLQIEVGNFTGAAPVQLIGATIRVRGVAGGLKNHQRQIVQPIVWVTPTADTFEVETSPPADLFGLTAQPVATLLSFPDTARPATVSKIAGQVTWAESPTHLFIRDASDSVEIRLQAPCLVRVGDDVQVAGFAEHGTIKPVLVDAFARVTGHRAPPPPIRRRSAAFSVTMTKRTSSRSRRSSAT